MWSVLSRVTMDNVQEVSYFNDTPSLQTFTKGPDRVVNTPASNSGVPGFESRPRDRLSELFVDFLSLSGQMTR
jgi:hypothetical protein